MCVGFEGVLTEVEGSGIVRTGVLLVGDRAYTIGLACVPEAVAGDIVIAHSGQAVRVVSSDGDGVAERPGVGLESEPLVDQRGVGVADLVDVQRSPIESSN
jgi:hydrogenase maturation factor